MAELALASILLHIVGVCSCPSHLVVIVPLNGIGECAACKQKYRIKSMDIALEPNGDPLVSAYRINIATEPFGGLINIASPGSTLPPPPGSPFGRRGN